MMGHRRIRMRNIPKLFREKKGENVMLTNNELKIIKGVENKERKKVLIYTILFIAVLLGIFLLGIGLILNEEGYKILGFIWVFLGIMPIVGIREQLKLFRIIKKLQEELEQNKQTTHSPETK